jgi:RNA polymerase sigma-70 factor (ECF subfamily)
LELSSRAARILNDGPMNDQLPGDEELLRRMAAGDEAAFIALYRRRQAGVYRFALHMSGSESTAEDVTQEVFLTLMRGGARFDSRRGSVASFLLGIARNHVLRWLRREGREEREEAELLSPEADPLDSLTRTETIESVRSAVVSLPVQYREVVVLCELQEMDYAQAAAVLGCAVGTVRSRLHRARGMLVARLRAEAPAAAGSR